MIRNVMVACGAVLRSRVAPADAVECPFRVMPCDVGARILRSDRYFAIAEAAQVDFVIRSGLMGRLFREGVHWANLAQSSRFRLPLRLLHPFTVVTRVECADAKHAYLSHRFVSREGEHALIGVKAKFKRGSLTIAPRELFGRLPDVLTPMAAALDDVAA